MTASDSDLAAATPRGDHRRLVDAISRLATFREPDEPGSTRRVFSDAYRHGRVWLREQMVAAGLDPHVDAGGNLVGVRRGRATGAPIVVGSHTDTVHGGGRYDGILGVVAGIEAARALHEAGVELSHDLWIVDYLGEEPNAWGMSCIGSRAVSAGLTATDLERDDGTGRTLRRALDDFGCDPDAAVGAGWPALHAAVELHIEQGPVLEHEGITIGVVTGIVGVLRLCFDFRGQRDHAGTMPMALRHDASMAAAELMLAAEAAGRELDGAIEGVATTGRVEVEPGAINVVPDVARVWVELRSIDHDWIESRRPRVIAAATAAATARGCTVDVTELSNERETAMHARIQAEIAAAAADLGYSSAPLASGAEHDTRQVARIAPVGMIFVPSIGGRSHCVEEATHDHDLAAGLATLIATIVRLDQMEIRSIT